MVSHTHTRSIGAGRVGETCSALSSHLTHDGEAAEADARFFFLSHGVDTETCERGEGTKIDEMRRRSDLEMVCDIKYLPPPRGWHEKISDALLEPRSGGTPDGWPWGLRRDARSLRKETSVPLLSRRCTRTRTRRGLSRLHHAPAFLAVGLADLVAEVERLRKR